MTIVAIDPGPTESAWVLFDGKPIYFAIQPNEIVLQWLDSGVENRATKCVIEMIGHYGKGMPAGKEVFDTCVWIGEFKHAFGRSLTDLILRPTVKAHLCGSARAKDANVRQAVIDRYGGGKALIKKGGVLYGVSKDVWQALGAAIAWTEMNGSRLPPLNPKDTQEATDADF